MTCVHFYVYVGEISRSCIGFSSTEPLRSLQLAMRKDAKKKIATHEKVAL